MKERVVVPEILDGLSFDDPRALRSRRDLRAINALMGNERWIRRRLAKQENYDKVSELGAGGGELLNELVRRARDCRGFDLQPRPVRLLETVAWSQGDFFETLAQDDAPIVVGSLILHHFEDEQLAALGRILAKKRVLVFAEPLRSRLALSQGYLVYPFVSEVTRHDMLVSIRAGFVKGELPAKLGLTEGWTWRERATLRGGLRLEGVRHPKIG